MAFANKVAALGAAVGISMVGKGALAQPTPVAVPAEWLEAQVNERGQKCDKRAERVDETGVLLACGAAGAWEVALGESGPRFVKSYEFGGEVVGFFVEPDGRLWVKLQVLEARPLSGAVSGAVSFPTESPATPAAALVPPAPASPSKPPRLASIDGADEGTTAEPTAVGEVLQAVPGEVIVSIGSANGVMPSDRIELSIEPDDDSGPASLSREVVAIGVVTHVSPHTAKVRLGLNERASVGATARATRSPPTATLISPPRVADVWSVEMMARPFAAIGELGGGVLLSGAVARRFTGNLVLRATLDPLALADVQNRESLSAVHAAAIVSYDSSFFEMGLGFGAQTVNDTDFFVEPGSGLNVVQLVRFGTQDGLNLSARTSVVLFRSEFEFGGMVANLQIPVSRGYWLQFGGGGGTVGYGFGEFGVRVLLDGNGHAGSKFLTVTAGGASLFRTGSCDENFFCQEERSYGGPMAGIGSEWRF